MNRSYASAEPVKLTPRTLRERAWRFPTISRRAVGRCSPSSANGSTSARLLAVGRPAASPARRAGGHVDAGDACAAASATARPEPPAHAVVGAHGPRSCIGDARTRRLLTVVLNDQSSLRDGSDNFGLLSLVRARGTSARHAGRRWRQLLRTELDGRRGRRGGEAYGPTRRYLRWYREASSPKTECGNATLTSFLASVRVLSVHTRWWRRQDEFRNLFLDTTGCVRSAPKHFQWSSSTREERQASRWRSASPLLWRWS